MREMLLDRAQDTIIQIKILRDLERNSLSSKKVGDPVNLENDIVGKYVERFLTFEKPAETSCQSVDLAFLAEHGFA